MIRRSVSPREQRTLALGTLAIAGLVLLGPGRRAERTWELRTQMTAQNLREQRQRSEELVRDASSARDSLAARRTRLRQFTSSLLTADTRATAGPALAGLLSRLSASSSISLSGMDVQIDSAPSHPLTIATVHLSGAGDINGVASLLSLLDASPAHVAIRTLTITQPAPTAPKNSMEMLRIDLMVSALVATWHSEPSK